MPRVSTGLIPPALSLREAIEAVQKIHERGGEKLSKGLFATALGYSDKSSGFGNRITALKQYGLANEEGGQICLTQLGMQIAAPTTEDIGPILVTVLRRISVFQFLHDKYSDMALPSEEIMKNVLMNDKKIEKEKVAKWVKQFLESATAARIVKAEGGRTHLLKVSGPGLSPGFSHGFSVTGANAPKQENTIASPKERADDRQVVSIPTKDGPAEISLPAQTSDATIDKIIKVLEALKSGDQA